MRYCSVKFFMIALWILLLQKSTVNHVTGFVTGRAISQGPHLRKETNTADRYTSTSIPFVIVLSAESSSWSPGDDWGLKSKQEHQSRTLETKDIFMQDIVARAAIRMEESRREQNMEEPDEFLTRAIEFIHHAEGEVQSGSDTSSASTKTILEATRQAEQEELEIAMMIRCNDKPQQILLNNNKVLPDLDPLERDDIQQLVTNQDDKWVATPFLKLATSQVFERHARRRTTDQVDAENQENNQLIMDRGAIRDWLQQSLGEEEDRYIGQFDSRIATLISMYGTSMYGSSATVERCGFTLQNLLGLYVSALVGDGNPKKIKYREEELRMVWRDLRNHGILSPIETDYQLRLEELRTIHETLVGNDPVGNEITDNMLDECEILDYNHAAHWEKDGDGQWYLHGKSSNELVELAMDKKTPLYLKDGDFVFIDEESCIGCMQCVGVSPASFQMTESGRARTFEQRNGADVKAAVASCPVNCMHFVGFDRLQELENARDSLTGDGRTDHKHFGPSSEHDGKWFAHTPLHVSGRDSDASHKSSWYHHFVNKCYRSNQCPQRGCFDCPRFANSNKDELNPFCEDKTRAGYHVRAETFIQRGDADTFRKTIDL